jgi:hypothetical protein
VFQGRFKALVVGQDEYFLTLLRYVQLNPYRAGLVDDPAKWSWSSMAASLGLSQAPPWLAVENVWDRFATRRRDAIARYREFLYAGMRETVPNFPTSGVVIGDDQCAAKVLERMRGVTVSEEIPKNERIAPPTLVQIFASAADTDSALRDAYRIGYPLKTIAAHVGAHYSTISLIARRTTSRMRASRIGLARSATYEPR